MYSSSGWDGKEGLQLVVVVASIRGGGGVLGNSGGYGCGGVLGSVGKGCCRVLMVVPGNQTLCKKILRGEIISILRAI